MMANRTLKAFIYVHDQQDLLALCSTLCKYGVELVSAGVTAEFLRTHHIAHLDISSQQPSGAAFDSNVLFNATKANKQIDMIIAHLPPLATQLQTSKITDVLATLDTSTAQLIRMAATHHHHMTIITAISDYPLLTEAVKKESQNALFRLRLATKALAYLAHYDGSVANALGTLNDSLAPEHFPMHLTLQWQKQSTLKHGDNTHQSAACYASIENIGNGLASHHLHCGRPLSFRDLKRLHRALNISHNIELPHVQSLYASNEMALHCDKELLPALEKSLKQIRSKKQRLYLSGEVTESMASLIIRSRSIEVLCAHQFTDAAIERLNQSPISCISIQNASLGGTTLQLATIDGGLLVQEANYLSLSDNALLAASLDKLSEQTRLDVTLAFSISKQLNSHNCVIIKSGRSIAISEQNTKQQLAIDACLLTATKRRISLKGAVVAVDSPVVNNQCIDALNEEGVALLVCPKLKHPYLADSKAAPLPVSDNDKTDAFSATSTKPSPAADNPPLQILETKLMLFS